MPLGSLAFLSNPYHRGGITRWMVDMSVAWRRMGGESWLAAPRPKSTFVNAGARPTVLGLLAAYPDKPLPTVISREVGGRFEFGTEKYRALVYATMVSQGVPPGVPILVSDDPAAWSAAASISNRNPLIAVLHSDGDAYYQLLAEYGKAASAIVCVSQRIAQRARLLTNDVGMPVQTIPCGTPLAELRRAARSDLPVRLVWVGRLEEGSKRVSDLPKILGAARREGVDCTLDIGGDGPALDATVGEMQRLGFQDRVRFHGWLSKDGVSSLLSDCDVLLLPSNYEGMPVTVMEALAHGCVVVASRVSGVEDFEDHPLASECFLVHSVGDVQAAAANIRRFCEMDPRKRVTAARAFAECEFSTDVCARRYAAVVAAVACAPRVATKSLRASAFIDVTSLAVSSQRRARLWIRDRLALSERS